MKRAATGAAAGGGRAAPGKRRAAALPLSDNFQAGDADLKIHSSDGIAFRVHKANLLASSKTFANMFEATSEPSQEGTLPIIELTEPAAVLERILPYCYPNAVAPWELDLPKGDLELFGALDKYELWRGIEAVQAAMLKELQWSLDDDDHEWYYSEFDDSLVCFAFAKHFNLPTLIPQAMSILAEGVVQRASRNLPYLIEKLEGAELGCLCSHFHQDSMIVSIMKYATAVLHQHSRITGIRKPAFRPACQKQHLDSAWNALRGYGTQEGLARAPMDLALCRECQVELKTRREILGNEMSKLKGADGGFP
ncbi:hypothetical protein RQP46_003671 [Phenoliferia psychrophenolica]